MNAKSLNLSKFLKGLRTPVDTCFCIAAYELREIWRADLFSAE